MTKHIIQKKIERHHKAQSLPNWFAINVKNARDFFHNNFQVGLQANPFECMGWNLENAITIQHDARQLAREKM